MFVYFYFTMAQYESGSGSLWMTSSVERIWVATNFPCFIFRAHSRLAADELVTAIKDTSFDQKLAVIPHFVDEIGLKKIDCAVLSKTDRKFTMEHFKRYKLGQYVRKIVSDRGVNVYVDLKAERRKSGNVFVLYVNYFRKNL